MNIERFHNELAMRLGYERIVKDKRIQISVEESDDPWVTLKIESGKDVRFRVTDIPDKVSIQTNPEIREIIDAMHQTYISSANCSF